VGDKLNFAKFVSIRKETIHTVPYAFYSMLSMFGLQENPGITRTEICGKGQGQKSAKNCHFTCCKEGLAFYRSYLRLSKAS
jgi:hypothetical protein